jgi:precorrin-6A synthase
MQAASLFDGFSFDLFPPFENGLTAPEVDVNRRQVVQALVVSRVVVVLDELLDALFELSWQVVVLQQDLCFEKMYGAEDGGRLEMRKIFIVGIGAGNPDYITVQAINALNEVDVFFVMDKGRGKEDLVRLRKEICERYIKDKSYRTIQIRDPERDRTAPSYEAGVKAWHDQRAIVYERLIRQELGEEECGAFLVWGDPSLYDSTLRIIDQITARGTIAFEYEVVPGISSIQALAARHRITLNRIGQSIHITTGRKISEGLPDSIGDVIVMLDAECSFRNVNDPETDIYWGAYIGTEDEILVSGNLKGLMHDIERIRKEAKGKKGWIMDTYLLRKVTAH